MVRIVINNEQIHDSFIAKGTWSCVPQTRVLKSYFDGNNVYHEKLSPHVRHLISFTIREHTIAEHEKVKKTFDIIENVPVSFYDDKSGTMRSGVFRIKDLTYSHLTTENGNPRYAEMQVELEEY